jgi:hypothetical protein
MGWNAQMVGEKPMNTEKVNYLKGGSDAQKAFFEYKKKTPERVCSVVDFVAGWNAANHSKRTNTEVE